MACFYMYSWYADPYVLHGCTQNLNGRCITWFINVLNMKVLLLVIFIWQWSVIQITLTLFNHNLINFPNVFEKHFRCARNIINFRHFYHSFTYFCWNTYRLILQIQALYLIQVSHVKDFRRSIYLQHYRDVLADVSK